MTLTLAEVAEALGLAPPVPPRAVAGWSTDSRTLESGDVFFALRGPSHDGHAYLRQVFARGAAAAIVGHRPADADPQWTLLVTADTQQALEQLGRYARQRFARPLVAITGSAGKTTTKDVIATLLSSRMRTGKTIGNLNNHIGVPLSLLRLPDDAEAAVLEMGMNHAGEIAHLTAIARPDVGVVTNVGYAHIENFDSIDGIAAAKRELIEGLSPDGTAVLNADDERVSRFAGSHAGRVITFGQSAQAGVRATAVQYSAGGARFLVDGIAIESGLPGRHGVCNVLAGLAVARVFGITPAELVDAVRGIEPGPMRGKRFERDGVVHFNDCYNSNPDAVRAMLDLVADTPGRRRIAVLGEMLELGSWSEKLHREAGAYAARCGIDVLVGIRGAARHSVDAAVDAGLPAGAAYFFSVPGEAGEWLKGQLRAGDVVLWKGSRGTKVEQALERFLS